LKKVKRQIGESDLFIETDTPDTINLAFSAIRTHREQLLAYIAQYEEFLHSFSPVEIAHDAPPIVHAMAHAAKIANVGPMAAVAGALADFALEEMMKMNPRIAIVENGGEITGRMTVPWPKPITIGIYAGESSPLSGRTGFCLEFENFPFACATSSATVGHAISFGSADAACVFADNAAIADACATAVCNAVIGESVPQSIQRGLDVAMSIKEIKGVLIIRENHVGCAGKLPRLIYIKTPFLGSKTIQ
jgi:ApbE superfamily uncharacterized protein (UPF0280 family)